MKSDVLRRALENRAWLLKMTWRRQVGERIEHIGFKKIYTMDRAKWRSGIYELSRNTKLIQPSHLKKPIGF